MIGVACHRGMVDDSSAARAILNPISSPYAPGSSLPLRLQPARRTLAALVFPSRVLSTSKVSRSPFLMLSGSMPDDCSALICRNHRVAHRHLFIEGLLISVGDLPPSARGETKFPEAVFTAAEMMSPGAKSSARSRAEKSQTRKANISPPDYRMSCSRIWPNVTSGMGKTCHSGTAIHQVPQRRRADGDAVRHRAAKAHGARRRGRRDFRDSAGSPGISKQATAPAGLQFESAICRP